MKIDLAYPPASSCIIANDPKPLPPVMLKKEAQVMGFVLFSYDYSKSQEWMIRQVLKDHDADKYLFCLVQNTRKKRDLWRKRK